MNNQSNDINQLPKDWKWVKLGEACNIIMGQSPPSTSYNTDGIGMPFFQGKAEFTELYPIVEKWCDAPNKIAEPNDILLSVRAPVGTTNIANQKCCIGRGLAAIRFENYKYAFYFLRSKQQELDSKGTGTTFRAISGETIRETLFPLPPKSTQQAIVSKIEELFSELDKGIENLRLAQQQLKTYRQSVLKWAFQGKLIESSVEWNYKPFKECLKFSQGLQVDVNLQSLTQKKGYARFLRIIDFTQGKDEHRFIENPGDRYFINKDEVALVRYGATTGFVCSGKEGVIANNLFKVTPVDKILNRFLFYFLNSTLFQNVIAQNIKGAAMPAISFGLINEVVLPYPSIEEQHNIVQAIESRLSVADKMEESITQSLQQSESLRQSILKKAFCGELVT